MEETTGTIRVMKHLDREARPKHILVIVLDLADIFYGILIKIV